jgi:tetratricopeptide (TPR) repeat protein
MTDHGAQSTQNAAVQSTPSENPSRAFLSRRRMFLLAICVLAVGWSGYSYWSIESGLKRGQQAAAKGHWSRARDHLSRYLAWHPDDATAHLLIAEALVRDNAQSGQDSVNRAIEHLTQIEDDSPLAAKARLQQARLSLLLLQRPAAAERLLRKSLELNSESLDANILMWKLMDVTGRHVVSRQYFWRAYEASPVSGRPTLLRDWFLAEFFPETANTSFHNATGARAVGKIPASISLLVRLRESEPEAHFVHAALATYYLERGQPKSSLELLKESPDLAQAMKDPFFVSVLFESLVDLGENEKATTCFEQFPEPHADYLYWRSKAMFHHYVTEDAAAAVDAYEEALTKWPAKFDWGLMTKLSECLRKIGRGDDAEGIQKRVNQLTTRILTEEKTSQLRDKLRRLNDPAVAGELCEIYTEFGLMKEANAWGEHRQKLSTSSPSFLPSSTSAK